jgi:hypothetical protein
MEVQKTGLDNLGLGDLGLSDLAYMHRLSSVVKR